MRERTFIIIAMKEDWGVATVEKAEVISVEGESLLDSWEIAQKYADRENADKSLTIHVSEVFSIKKVDKDTVDSFSNY